MEFLTRKPAVCARFRTHPWSPVIPKQIQQLAASGSEAYLTIRSSLPAPPVVVCVRSRSRASVRGPTSSKGKSESVLWRKMRPFVIPCLSELCEAVPSQTKRTHPEEICFQVVLTRRVYEGSCPGSGDYQRGRCRLMMINNK